MMNDSSAPSLFWRWSIPSIGEPMMTNSSIVIPIVSVASPDLERTFKFLTFAILPVAYLVGQKVFELIVRSL